MQFSSPSWALTPPSAAPLELRADGFPSPAVRARSVATRELAAVCVAGSTYARPLTHAVTADGRVYVVVGADGAVDRLARADADPHLPGMLVVTDVCPVSVRDRVRGTLWLTGWLSPVPTVDSRSVLLELAGIRPVECLLDVGHGASLLQLELHDVILSDGTGIADVPAAEFCRAAPDPLLRDETSALRHLDAVHRDVLDELVRRLPDPPPGRCWVRPVALDSHGLTLRVDEHGSCRDVRVPFDRPLAHADELARAVAALRSRPVTPVVRPPAA